MGGQGFFPGPAAGSIPLGKGIYRLSGADAQKRKSGKKQPDPVVFGDSRQALKRKWESQPDQDQAVPTVSAFDYANQSRQRGQEHRYRNRDCR